jgi:outer membrane protein assembly factor BamB
MMNDIGMGRALGSSMLIAAVCPRCESIFKVDEGLRGKRMRCPNPLCKAVFEVQAEGEQPAAAVPKIAEPAPPEKSPSTVTGSVMDMLPVLPAELAEPAPPALEKPAESKRKDKPAAPSTAPKKAPPQVVPEPSRATPAWQNLPPPVRSTVATISPQAPPVDFPDDFPDDDVAGSEAAVANGMLDARPSIAEAPPPRARPSRRRPLLAIAAMLILLAGTLGVGWWVVEGARAGSEADRFNRAQELYEQQDYAEAHAVFNKLVRDFATGPGARKYRFLAQLSGVRAEAYAAEELAQLTPALEHTLQFTAVNQNEPLLKDRHLDMWQTLRRLAERLTAQADKQHERAALEAAEKAWAEAKRFQPPGEIGEKLVKEFARVKQALDVYDQRQEVLGTLKGLIAHVSALEVKQARDLVLAAGLKDDAEAVALLADLVQAHRAAIQYQPAITDNIDDPVDEDALPGLLVAPALVKAKVAAPDGRIALALARGVLYGLGPQRGSVRWGRRVGIDSSVLPLRVPADPITPELALVLSSDSHSVTAVVVDNGTVVWRRRLGSPCTGQPVLVGRSLLVPTLAGRVDEIEISAGRPLGHYPLGQRLTVGGARLEGTSLVFFPGDEFCVYVLDAAKRTCEEVLYANHPAGSLRGAPILLHRRRASAADKVPVKGPKDWLLLCQATGTDAVEVRPFELPIRDPDQPAGAPLRAKGLSWFAPWHDAEKLALATDAGLLSLWGIRQKGNRDDPLLFPLLKTPYPVAGRSSARAQVVHADAEGYWVLVGGKLHRLNAVMRAGSGPDLVAAGPEPMELGSPLHAAEHHENAAGRQALLLTTLARGRPSCLCSAVDAASGQLHWQRQLGCVPLHPLAVLGSKVLLRDPTGLLLLDPAAFPDKPGTAWQTAGEFALREPLAADDRVVLLTGASEFVQLAWSSKPGSAKLHLRIVGLTGASAIKTVDLHSSLGGTPALGDGCVLLPLADGEAVRLDRADGTLAAGPNWRAAGADEQSTGHIVALGGDEFLLTDGSRGLSRVSWPSAKVHERLQKAELSQPIIAPPAVLPAIANAKPRVCVADAADTVTLLDSERLAVLRRWPMTGKITAGPFVRGTLIVCVVDNKRLVGIDPDRDKPWQYTMVSNIVGAPLLVEDMLVAANVSGQFLALRPVDGQPIGAGKGFTLKANVAADTAPVPFGAGRLLVPLNDGTLLLLPLAKLR